MTLKDAIEHLGTHFERAADASVTVTEQLRYIHRNFRSVYIKKLKHGLELEFIDFFGD
jgi:hypothetical protein